MDDEKATHSVDTRGSFMKWGRKGRRRKKEPAENIAYAWRGRKKRVIVNRYRMFNKNKEIC